MIDSSKLREQADGVLLSEEERIELLADLLLEMALEEHHDEPSK